jgi:O-antigen ligase
MQIKPSNISGFFKSIEIKYLVILFIWISFFPQPLQEKYHLYTNISLILIFLFLFVRNRFALFKPTDYSLWVFLLAISINVFFAQQKNIALKTYLDLAIAMFIIYYLVSEDFFSEKSFNLLVKTICISSIIVSLGAVLEFLFAYNPIYENVIENPYYKRYISGFVRTMSTQFHPVVLGSYLLGSLPFNFKLFKQNNPYLRLLGSLGIVLNIIVIILTFSRGVILGLIAAVMFYLIMQKKFRLIVIFFVILVFSILLCSYLPYPVNRFGKDQMIMENRGILSGYRFTRCAMTLRIIKEHPLVGLGFQHFRIRFYEYFPHPLVGLGFQHFRIRFYEYFPSNYNVPYEFMIPDNMYLTFLAETGIIGTLGFFILIFSLLKKASLHLKRIEDDNRRLMLLMPMSALIGLLVNMAAYELFYWATPYMLFCIICTLLKRDPGERRVERTI